MTGRAVERQGDAGEAGRDGFWFLGTHMVMKASGETTQGQAGVIEQSAPAGFVAPPHVHRREDEAFYVLDGRVLFHRGDEEILAPAGSFVWLPRSVPHWFQVEGPGGATLLQFNWPAGLERFFEELGTAVANPDELPDVERLLAVAATYEIDMLAAKPSQ